MWNSTCLTFIPIYSIIFDLDLQFFGLKFFFSSQRELHSVPNIEIFLLRLDFLVSLSLS